MGPHTRTTDSLHRAAKPPTSLQTKIERGESLRLSSAPKRRKAGQKARVSSQKNDTERKKTPTRVRKRGRTQQGGRSGEAAALQKMKSAKRVRKDDLPASREGPTEAWKKKKKRTQRGRG